MLVLHLDLCCDRGDMRLATSILNNLNLPLLQEALERSLRQVQREMDAAQCAAAERVSPCAYSVLS